jgi:hypothetical protein
VWGFVAPKQVGVCHRPAYSLRFHIDCCFQRIGEWDIRDKGLLKACVIGNVFERLSLAHRATWALPPRMSHSRHLGWEARRYGRTVPDAEVSLHYRVRVSSAGVIRRTWDAASRICGCKGHSEHLEGNCKGTNVAVRWFFQQFQLFPNCAPRAVLCS